MSLGRISKLFAAQNASQVVSLLTQLLLPPTFLHNYGVTLYGEWLALSAAIDCQPEMMLRSLPDV